MINEQRIKARVVGRATAEELHNAFLADVSKKYPEHGADYAEALLERLAEMLPHRRMATPEIEKPEPIARLGCNVIPFGKHASRQFDEVPLDYLDWLCREQEGFYKTLRAYLTHPELESRRGTTD